MAKRCARSMVTQSVVFPKAYGVGPARRWLKEHGLTSRKVHATKGTLRFRQLPPTACKRGNYATIKMGATGIRKIICCPK